MTTRAIAAVTPQDLLVRLMESSRLAELVQALEPRVLHALVRHCGLEDCGPIVALATTEQLTAIFDDDLWRSETPGEAEALDADRFGLWLEVLAEVGPEVAAGKLVAMDFDFVTAALSQHLLVVDADALIELYLPEDVEMGEPDTVQRDADVQALLDGVGLDLNGYTVVARHDGVRTALLEVLMSLDRDHHAFLSRLLARCCRLSTELVLDNGGLWEVLTGSEQVLDDAAGARDERRGAQGHVSARDASAFLDLSRKGASSDPVSARYFRDLARRAAAPQAPARTALDPALAQEVSTFVARLDASQRAGRVPRLLAAGPGDRLGLVRGHLARASDRGGAIAARCADELGYLANTLMAGASFRSRRFRTVEAADAVLAVCNLGLERALGERRATADLVAAFRSGWRILHEDVVAFVARRLHDVLADIRCGDRALQAGVDTLRRRLAAELQAGRPWRAAQDLDVLSSLDLPSWSILTDLVAECPAVPRDADRAHGPLLHVTRAFEFVSERRQIEWVERFVETMPERLVG